MGGHDAPTKKNVRGEWGGERGRGARGERWRGGESCHICAKHRTNKLEPLCPSPFPERPLQVLGTDLFYSQSVDYLLVIDFFMLCGSCCIN